MLPAGGRETFFEFLGSRVGGKKSESPAGLANERSNFTKNGW
jgi:hypothetical protein